jgi:hypothetical protein
MEQFLPKTRFQHFMLLFYAMRIFCDKNSQTDELIQYGCHLCRKFVHNYSNTYMGSNIVYNVHSLIHLSDDVRRFGVLDKCSAFRYENALGMLKRKLHGGNLPLHQVCGRIHETGLLLLSDKKPPKAALCVENWFLIPSRMRDSCAQLADKSFCIIVSICGSSANVTMMKRVQATFSYPRESDILHIFTARRWKKSKLN